jgi:uncharacterized protein (DUF924 family)
MSDIAALLDFWFAPETAPKWFAKDAAFDATLRTRFGTLPQSAAAGALDHWAATAHGALALVLLLDQLPRNLYRDDARAFVNDPHALAIARSALARGFDRGLPEQMRQFLYMPFMHAEELAAQERCCTLFADQPEQRKYAEAHRDIIARFGRFPHRNAVLGRASTPEETAFLAGPNASF